MSRTTVDIGSFVNGRLDGKEDAINKVTSLSSSSTDTEYPSAKCVYDKLEEINDLIGDAIAFINK